MIAVQALAVLVFVVTFILIAVEAIHRTHASLLGAFVFVLRARITAKGISVLKYFKGAEKLLDIKL